MSPKTYFGVKIPVVRLNSGHSMPLMAAGTAIAPPFPVGQPKMAVLDAIESGYRYIDTASMYATEEAVGAAIKEALERELIKNRDELFVSTKLWCNNAHPDRVRPAVKESLRKLGLEYVDLYLIHAPVTMEPHVVDLVPKEGEISIMDIKSVWAAMEEVHKLGLAKSIGVSNFTCKKLTELLAHAEFIPAVNQVEMHPAMQQKRLREFCEEKGMHVSAYSPLGGKEWGFDVIMENNILKEIARNKEKSVAQIAMRWGYEQGVSLITKSFNKRRLEENLDIFDWKLTNEELQKIALISQTRIGTFSEFVFPGSPYKTVEELWDHEM
ncbi:hypothetical protein Sjap_020394 [Stephania japonica]|uniref:codeinone reductase (NADPH) n=1 Tax=Stephania japonica TaxID=461633 RepID=A0AAP0I0E4_9MAGN